MSDEDRIRINASPEQRLQYLLAVALSQMVRGKLPFVSDAAVTLNGPGETAGLGFDNNVVSRYWEQFRRVDTTDV